MSARGSWPVLAVGVVLGAALIAVGGRFVWPLPGGLAPISLQTLAVLVVAFAVGPLAGTGAVAVYLAAAAAGLPVLANGASGVAVLLGHGGGYFLGFLAAPTVATLVAGGGRGYGRALRVLLGGLAAHAVILVLGVLWLVLWHRQPSGAAIDLALLPFLVPALIKSALLALWVPLSARAGLAWA